jgi:hypothetical protein
VGSLSLEVFGIEFWCQELKKDLHQLENNPLLINIMDQRMEVDVDSMDSYPNGVPGVWA